MTFTDLLGSMPNGATESDEAGDPSAGTLVPDLDKLHGQDTGCLAMIRVERDRSTVIEICLSHVDAMQFACNQLSHITSPSLALALY